MQTSVIVRQKKKKKITLGSLMGVHCATIQKGLTVNQLLHIYAIDKKMYLGCIFSLK